MSEITSPVDSLTVGNSPDLELGQVVVQDRERRPVSLTVNNQIHTITVDPRMTLLDELVEKWH